MGLSGWGRRTEGEMPRGRPPARICKGQKLLESKGFVSHAFDFDGAIRILLLDDMSGMQGEFATLC